MLKNKRSPGAWENLELRLQLQGKHGSGSLVDDKGFNKLIYFSHNTNYPEENTLQIL